MTWGSSLARRLSKKNATFFGWHGSLFFQLYCRLWSKSSGGSIFIRVYSGFNAREKLVLNASHSERSTNVWVKKSIVYIPIGAVFTSGRIKLSQRIRPLLLEQNEDGSIAISVYELGGLAAPHDPHAIDHFICKFEAVETLVSVPLIPIFSPRVSAINQK